MASDRLRCPLCVSPFVVPLSDVLWSIEADYFRCRDCGGMWTISTGRKTKITVIARSKPKQTERQQFQ